MNNSILSLSCEMFEAYLLKTYPALKTLFLTLRKFEIKLEMIEIHKDNRKKGIGTLVMNDLIEYADYNQYSIELVPAIQDSYRGTTSRRRLVNFYKQFDFVENTGRNKDFKRISGCMYRLPQ